jgi:DNA/RNA endonuclease G (NUC1)
MNIQSLRLQSIFYKLLILKNMKKVLLFILFVVLITLGILFIVQSCAVSKEQYSQNTSSAAPSPPKESAQTSTEVDDAFTYLYDHRSSTHAPFGYPQDNDTLDDFIIEKSQYILSYCGEKNSPNWVAWELNASWLGDVPRKTGRFLIEPNLPDGYYQVTHDDYTHSGYDRGHLVRSKERTKTIEDNISTFEMGNIVPQTPDLNRGVWLRFEDYCLDKAIKEQKNMYIVAGGIFRDTITLKSEGKVVIPDSCFKIVLFSEETDPARINFDQLETISVAMPNTAGIRGDAWEKYETTVGRIEQSTGYRFFGKVRLGE